MDQEVIVRGHELWAGVDVKENNGKLLLLLALMRYTVGMTL